MAARVSQTVVEALILPDDVSARVSQTIVEALILPDDVIARVSQFVIEVLILPPQPSGPIITESFRGPPIEGAPWTFYQPFSEEDSFPFGRAPDTPGPPAYAPENILGPIQMGAPWNIRTFEDGDAHLYGAAEPPVATPNVYAPEVTSGPPIMGSPWLSRIPSQEFGYTTPPPVVNPGDPGSEVDVPTSRMLFVPRVIDLKDQRRTNRFTEIVSDAMNSLIRKGQLTLTGINDWNITGGDYDGGTF